MREVEAKLHKSSQSWVAVALQWIRVGGRCLMAGWLWRVASATPIAAIVVACGGSSVEFIGVPADGGDDGSSSDGSPEGGGSGNDSGGRDGATVDGGATDAPASGCNYDGGAFPIDSFTAGCVGTDSCVKVFHEVSCCGDQLAIGINHSASQTYAAAEQAWEATCPKCGCPVSGNVIAQDGKTGPADQVQVQCDMSGPTSAGKCKTYFP
jgi:hypothetical protein